MADANGILDPELFAVYRAMLRLPDLSDAELAIELGMSAKEVADLVLRLERLGFVSFGEEPEDRSPTHPDMAMAGFAISVWNDATGRVAELARLTRLLGELNGEFDAGHQRTRDALEFEILPSSEAANWKLMELTDQCRADYCFLRNANEVDRVLLERRHRSQHPTHEPEQELIQRGGRVRHIHPSWVRELTSWVEDIIEDSAHGVEVRLGTGDAAAPPMMAIFDNEVALVPRDLNRTSSGAIVVRSQSMVAALRWQFETYWRQCTPFDIEPGQAGRRREILRLLAVGSKDEAIARSVGVGLRTIRREISDLMDELGAGSRFQLGVLAAGQGLIN